MKKLFIILFSIQILLAGNVQELQKGDSIKGSVERAEKKYYKVDIQTLKDVHVTLTNLSANVNLYLKTDDNPTEELLPRIRKNDCYSSNNNNEDEECRYQILNDGKRNDDRSVFVYIMVYGIEAGNYTLTATEEQAEKIPVLTNATINDSVEYKKYKQYQVTVKQGKEVTVKLSDLTADADLRVKFGRKANKHTFDCKSNNGGTKADECTVTPKEDGTLYVQVDGYKAASYSLKATTKTGGGSKKCLTKFELIDAIKEGADVSDVNTSCIEDMSFIFYNNKSFNQDISSWDTSNVRSMNNMFNGATSFNQDISSWNLSNVDDMSSLFKGATSFNQNIGSWNVSNVRNMSNIFKGATSFNQNIGSWNVSKVKSMMGMFQDATSFNQDISSWDVSNVENMSYMFNNTSNFSNHNLSSWNIVNVIVKNNFADGVGAGNTAPRWEKIQNQKLIKIAKDTCLDNKDNSTPAVLCSNEENIIYILENYIGLEVAYHALFKVNITSGGESVTLLRERSKPIWENPHTSEFFIKKLENTLMYGTYTRSDEADERGSFNFSYKNKIVLSFGYVERDGILNKIYTSEEGNKLHLEYDDRINTDNPRRCNELYDISNPADPKIIDKKCPPLVY